jgi:hypothetical protein
MKCRLYRKTSKELFMGRVWPRVGGKEPSNMMTLIRITGSKWHGIDYSVWGSKTRKSAKFITFPTPVKGKRIPFRSELGSTLKFWYSEVNHSTYWNYVLFATALTGPSTSACLYFDTWVIFNLQKKDKHVKCHALYTTCNEQQQNLMNKTSSYLG